MLRIAFQGARGAFSEAAVMDMYWHALPMPMDECSDVAAAVARGDVDAGVLALRNSMAGPVVPAYDAIDAHDSLVVTADVVVAVRQCLLALPGATLESIRSIESHPIALAQCRAFLQAHPHITPVESYDTAGAAAVVANSGDTRRAALASRAAARRYGLSVLAANVQDSPDNHTRFVAVTRAGTAFPASSSRPASSSTRSAMLLLTIANKPAAPRRITGLLAEHGLAPTSIDVLSPQSGHSSRVAVEIDYQQDDPAMPRALRALSMITNRVRVVGTLVRDRSRPALPDGVTFLVRGA